MKLKNSVYILTLIMASYAQAQPASVELVTVADGFSNGIGLANAGDGSNRLFVVQQPGEVRIWDGLNVLSNNFLDISSLVSTGQEQGLLGLAFHPDYENNGFIYVNYTDLTGDTVIARYQISVGDMNIVNPSSALQILTFNQPNQAHNGGDIHFGSDGYLYIATGDGGTPAGNAQDINNLLGKILRIDIDGDDFPGDPDKNYSIPADNPFAGATPGADEIWLMGLRNPWRFSFDRLNGDIFIGDVGEGAWEEVNHLSSGGIGGENFGWPCYEGVDEFNTTGCGAINEYVFPITALPHGAPPNNNLSVIGGYRYRGSQFSSLSGWYFYTDWATGFLWAAEPGVGATWDAYNVASMGTFSVTGFGEGENGELYVIRNWIISQIIDPTDLIFLNGFE